MDAAGQVREQAGRDHGGDGRPGGPVRVLCLRRRRNRRPHHQPRSHVPERMLHHMRGHGKGGEGEQAHAVCPDTAHFGNCEARLHCVNSARARENAVFDSGNTPRGLDLAAIWSKGDERGAV